MSTKWMSTLNAETGLPVLVNLDTGALITAAIDGKGRECVEIGGVKLRTSVQVLAYLLEAAVMEPGA